MNCENFLNLLPEYVDEQLPPARRQAADGHLAECADCRHALEQEQVVSRILSQGFRQSVGHLTLPADFLERMETALREESAAKIIPLRESPPAHWLRLLWPAAMAACVLFTSFHAVHLFPVAPATAPANLASATPTGKIAVHYSICMPTWKFRQEGDHVIDTLSYQTIVVSGILPAGQHIIPPPTDRKMPL